VDGALIAPPYNRNARSRMSQLVGLLLLLALAAPQAQTNPAPLEAFSRAIATAESSLAGGDAATIEQRYRDALVQGWTILGALALTDGRTADARAAFARAGAERGSAVTPTADPALAALSAEERGVAARQVTTALAGACFNLGVLAAQSRRFAQAVERFDCTARLDPAFPRLQYSLGIACFNAGQYQRALAPLRQARRESPGDGGIRRMLALADFNTGEYAEAATLLADDQGRLQQPALQYAYGVALVRSDRAAEAERIFGELLSTHGDSAEVNVVLGMAQAQQGDLEPAIESLNRALAIQPDVAGARAALGTIYLKQGRLPEAEEALRGELSSHADDVTARQTLATVLDLRGRDADALGVLRPLLAVRPDDADARYLAGKILLKQGAAADAIVELERAVKLAPDEANIHYQLGQAYQRTGRSDLAAAQFDLVRRLKDQRRAQPR
jgi:Flp pilus assembly protein TadD